MDEIKFGDIHVVKFNESYMQLAADSSILKEIGDFFSYEVPGAQFQPKVRNGLWDGRIRLFNYKNQTLYVGLYAHLRVFAEDRKYNIIEHETILGKNDIKFEEYTELIESLNIHNDGNSIKPYYFQETSILHCMRNDRTTIVSPTSSGKSLIIYALSEYHRRKGSQILIIVPTINLVLQLFADFKDYSSEIEWDPVDHCHKIYTGQEKDSIKPIIISTWQSMQSKPAKYFHKFGVAIVDEVHGAKATQITKILENCINAKVRYGLTGTLQEAEVHKLVILGLLGPDRKIIGTKQLMDEGYVADLSIKAIVLKYSNKAKKELWKIKAEIKKSKKGSAYAAEMKYIVENEERMKCLVGLSSVLKGNTLILFQYIEHGKAIEKQLKDNTDKKVFYISGETKPDERERIRGLMETNDDIILTASYGTFSTGVSVKNIHNVIFGSPSKSKIKVLQTIGRGLRISKTKVAATLYDFVDDLTYKTKKNKHLNYVIKHFHERWKIYRSEGFKTKIYERQI